MAKTSTRAAGAMGDKWRHQGGGGGEGVGRTRVGRAPRPSALFLRSTRLCATRRRLLRRRLLRRQRRRARRSTGRVVAWRWFTVHDQHYVRASRQSYEREQRASATWLREEIERRTEAVVAAANLGRPLALHQGTVFRLSVITQEPMASVLAVARQCRQSVCLLGKDHAPGTPAFGG